ncbi:nitroreductase family protein [Shimazuella kribbensis]|uniref:nitroreductase family protein n=1 Tax=Shimazuella kribbensis TaxID=139808 RepID=UPI00040CD265|nr:nitroreductase family protein [Shimazuella kribbensis]
MQKSTTLQFDQLVRERKSVREFQKHHMIPQEELHEIIRMAQTAPSAWNLQHWKVIVVQDPEQKRALLPIANNQQQVVDASAVFIILGDLEANKNVEKVHLPLVHSGVMPKEVYSQIAKDTEEEYKLRNYKSRDSAFLNASLFSMQLMLAAKSIGYDTVPMGGFQVDPLIEKLHIPKRFVPVMMMTIGIASSSAYTTTRLSLDDVIIHESF